MRKYKQIKKNDKGTINQIEELGKKLQGNIDRLKSNSTINLEKIKRLEGEQWQKQENRHS